MGLYNRLIVANHDMANLRFTKGWSNFNSLTSLLNSRRKLDDKLSLKGNSSKWQDNWEISRGAWKCIMSCPTLN